MAIPRRPNSICGRLLIKVTLQFYNLTRFVIKTRNKASLRSLKGQFRGADFVNIEQGKNSRKSSVNYQQLLHMDCRYNFLVTTSSRAACWLFFDATSV